MNARNLIVCIDGTANQFGKKVRVLGGYPVTLLANVVEKNTNVIELYNLILKKVEHNQRTWYNSGIGTYARPSWKSFKFYRQVLSHKIDLAIAWCVESSHYLFHALILPLAQSGILKERFWLHTSGCQVIMRKVIVFFCSVRWNDM
jgi:uncharacterized protein (DUF2235 family)